MQHGGVEIVNLQLLVDGLEAVLISGAVSHATLYPSAIPESLRRKPVKRAKAKVWKEIMQPLPFAVIGALAGMEEVTKIGDPHGDRIIRIPNTRAFQYSQKLDKPWRVAVNFVIPHDIMFFSSGEKQEQSRANPRFMAPLRPPLPALYLSRPHRCFFPCPPSPTG